MMIQAAVVRKLRLDRGWTQQQLADVSSLSLRTIQRVERQGQGSMETCNALCAVLETERAILFGTPTRGTSQSRRTWTVIVLASVLAGFACGVSVTLLLS